jgi:hypothetical protein
MDLLGNVHAKGKHFLVHKVQQQHAIQQMVGQVAFVVKVPAL